jgi:predicted phosphoribosyltransferase
MSDFADLRDGGRQLAPLLARALVDRLDAVLLPLLPNGVPVTVGLLDGISLPVRALAADRSAEGVVVRPPSGIAGGCCVVVDDGVETGTAARAAAAALREAGADTVILAVPVCPREALADLQHRFDEVVAVAKPLARRALRWHYDDFDTVDREAAEALLRDLPGALP